MADDYQQIQEEEITLPIPPASEVITLTQHNISASRAAEEHRKAQVFQKISREFEDNDHKLRKTEEEVSDDFVDYFKNTTQAYSLRINQAWCIGNETYDFKPSNTIELNNYLVKLISKLISPNFYIWLHNWGYGKSTWFKMLLTNILVRKLKNLLGPQGYAVEHGEHAVVVYANKKIRSSCDVSSEEAYMLLSL